MPSKPRKPGPSPKKAPAKASARSTVAGSRRGTAAARGEDLAAAKLAATNDLSAGMPGQGHWRYLKNQDSTTYASPTFDDSSWSEVGIPHGANYLTVFKPSIETLRRQGYPDVASVTPSTRFGDLRAFLVAVLKATTSNAVLGQLLWAVGWVIVAYIGLLIYAARKHLRASAVFIALILVNVVFVMAIAPASDYRYLYFAYLSVFVTPLLLLAEAPLPRRDAVSAS